MSDLVYKVAKAMWPGGDAATQYELEKAQVAIDTVRKEDKFITKESIAKSDIEFLKLRIARLTIQAECDRIVMNSMRDHIVKMRMKYEPKDGV